jgi:hypothetical protein
MGIFFGFASWLIPKAAGLYPAPLNLEPCWQPPAGRNAIDFSKAPAWWHLKGADGEEDGRNSKPTWVPFH